MVLVLAAVAALGVPTSTPGAGEDNGVGVVLYRDGDLVVFAKGASVSAPAVAGDGYTVYRDSTLREHYTIRLVESSGVERLRPHLEAVAATMRDDVGRSVTVAPGTVAADATTGVGQIDVRVSSSAPCSGSWLGCASPVVDGGEISEARVWINPRLLTRSSQALDNGVRHELGHAFGLGHFNGEFDGHLQTMHATSFDALSYRSGDLAGLGRGLTGSQPASTPASATPQVAPAAPAPPVAAASTSADPSGDMHASAGPVGIVIRGHAVDVDATEPVVVTVTLDDQTFSLAAAKLDESTGQRNAYEVVWSVGPGTHRVCVVAHNIGAGSDATLGCDDIEITIGGIGQLGLQTL
ncbi:MAG: hypothetical protein OSA99_09800 [Acidimicrobiales bacterium]|nr:hypothetical protein [Acidimicrobiales bacterium]